jgi:hypothetical protein
VHEHACTDERRCSVLRSSRRAGRRVQTLSAARTRVSSASYPRDASSRARSSRSIEQRRRERGTYCSAVTRQAANEPELSTHPKVERRLEAWCRREARAARLLARVLHHCCMATAQVGDPRLGTSQRRGPRSTPNSYIDIPKDTSRSAAPGRGFTRHARDAPARRRPLKTAVSRETRCTAKVTASLANSSPGNVPTSRVHTNL